jgi:uncharacterized protein VirK/YbjX
MLQTSIPSVEIRSPSFELSGDAASGASFQCPRVTSDYSQIPMREVDKLLGPLRWVILLIRLKISWSPAVIAGEFWRVLTNIGTQREIFRLLRLRPLDQVAQDKPGLAFKYVVPDYLARRFSVSERAACFLHHYRRIHAALSENALRQILKDNVVLHNISHGSNHFTLTIGSPEHIGRLEGELSVDLRVNGKSVFNLSFIIVPGWVLKSDADEILLITRLQGAFGSRPQIELVRRAFHEFSPRKLLLSVVQGFADAFGIGELQAVCATNQRCYEKKYSASLKRGYDDFFTNVGMIKTAAGFYSSPIPIKTKPLASIKGRNRSRARKSRAMRQQIQLASAEFLLGAAQRSTYSSTGAVDQPSIEGAGESRLRPVAFREEDYNPSP